MKCIKKASEVKRVDDEDAVMLVKSGWAYCPKSEWKSKRPARKDIQSVSDDDEVEDSESSKNSKASKKGQKIKVSKKDRVPRNEARGGNVESVSSKKKK